MRRVTALCVAATIAVSLFAIPGIAAARPAHAPASGYYVIRWHDTGVCQIWNTELTQTPWQIFSQYDVVSKPVPTFAAAAAIQENMRFAHHCTL